jgi:hypothetical protein
MYGGSMGNSYFQCFISGIGEVLRPEKLEELPEIRVDRTRRSFLSWLLKPEILPVDEAKKSMGWSFFSWLLAPEALPVDPPAACASVRPSVLSVVFSRERLPDEPPPGSVAGNSGSRG